MSNFESLEKAMCKELEAIDQKLKSGVDLNTNELDRADKLAHALKSLATYTAMKNSEEYGDYEGGMSGYRGRGANGRYVSREAGNSYAEGYSRGYNEARSQMEAQSGRYPYMSERYRY